MKTRPILAGLILVASPLFATVASADPPARVGRLSYLSGPVSFAPAGLDEWSEALMNRPVTTGDRLWTDHGARAEVRIGSTAVRMAARTSVDVLNLDDSMMQLRLAQGTLNVRVKHLPYGGGFEIDTPTTAVQVQRPGIYRIDADPSGTRTTVTVHSGEVTVGGWNANFALYDDESATLYSDSPDYDYTEAPPMDAFDRFCAWRDRRDDRARSVRYVPQDMTGYEDLDAYGTWNTVPTYGTVWFPTRVGPDWVPYRQGRWLWVEPWGWTWVDEAPWGFAPFHYGRWAYIGGRWGWCPGEARARPVYAPALVAFVGGSGFSLSVSVGGGPAVGWFPLGYREPYIPWYSASPAYVQQVNVAHVTNVTHITNITSVTHVTNVNYANRSVPSAVTAVPGATFTQSRPVTRAVLAGPAMQQLARAPVVGGGAPIAPVRESLRGKPADVRPPETVLRRPVVAVRPPPPAPASFAVRQAEIAKEEPNRPFHVRPLPAVSPAAPSPGARGAPQGAITQPPVRVIQPPRPSPAAAGRQSSGGPGAPGAPPSGREPPGRPPEGRTATPAQQPERRMTDPGKPPGAPGRPPETEAPKAPPGAPQRQPGAQERALTEVPRPPQPEERAKPRIPTAPPAASPPEAPRPPPPPGAEQHARPGPQPPQPPRGGEERVRPLAPPDAPQSSQPPRREERRATPAQAQPPQVEERARPAPQPPRGEERPRAMQSPPNVEERARPLSPPQAARGRAHTGNDDKPPVEKDKGDEGRAKREERR